MTDKDNRPPGESPSFRRSPGRRRGEPPLIDAAPIELPPGAHERAPGSAEVQGDDWQPHESAVPPAPAQEEPVLFGGAARDVPARGEGGGEAAAEPARAESFVTDPEPDTATRDDALPREVDAAAVRGIGASPEPRDASMPLALRRSPAAPVAWLLALAVVGLLGAIAWLLATEGQRSGRDDLVAAVAALRARLGTIEGRPDAADALRQGIAAATKRLDAFDAGQVAAGNQASEVASRLEALAKDAAAARADAVAARADAATAKDAAVAARVLPRPPSGEPATAPPSDAALSALDKKVSELGQTVATLVAVKPPGRPPPVDLGPLERRVGTLESGLSKLTGVEGRLSALAETVATLAAVKPPEPPPPVDLGPLERKMAGLDKGLSALQAAIVALPDVAPFEKRTDDLTRRIGAAEAALAAPRPNEEALQRGLAANTADSKAAKLAVASQSLALAFDAGQPYGAELDALRALGVDADTLAPLAPAAARGAPTLDSLRAQWAGVREEVRGAGKTEPSRSMLDRFVSGARSVVRVRGAEEAPQDAADPAIARIDAALAAKDLGAALAAWASLPEAGKQASRDWADAAVGRRQAGGAADALFARALGALGQPKG